MMRLQISQVASGVYRLWTRYTNWYLVEDGGRLTVVDTGLPGDWSYYEGALTGIGRSVEDIDAVLITHHHPDHVGNAERLRAVGARVIAHPVDAPFLLGERGMSRRGYLRYAIHPWYGRYLLHLVRRGVTRVEPLGQLEEMRGGDVVAAPGSPRVIHTPGNTAGHCAFYLEDQSILFSGDALTTLDCTRGRREPTIILGPSTEDRAAARRSLDALAATEASLVLPGHGEPWTHGVGSAVEIAQRSC